MAGGEFRFGTASIYMAQRDNIQPNRTSQMRVITWTRFRRPQRHFLSTSAAFIVSARGKLGLEELEIPDLTRWTFDHDVVELCTAVKGAMLCKLLDEGAKKVVYLDPDTALLDDLAPVASLLDRHSVVLTPHLVEPDDAR